MPLVDRGVDMLDKAELEDSLGGNLAVLEFLPVLLMPALLASIYKFKVFNQFPSNLYKWIIVLDWIYALAIGPLRWLPGNVLFDQMTGALMKEGDGNCKFAVFIDTFCQVGLLYTNTCIAAAVFFMAYFGEDFKDSRMASKYYIRFLLCFLIIVCGTTAVTTLGESHAYVGWCTADSANVICKQLVWFLSIVCQITMCIPTNYIIYVTTKENNNKNKEKREKDKKAIFPQVIGSAFYTRYSMVLLTQIIGIYPSLIVEFLGLARKMVPGTIMTFVISGIPLAHILDIAVLSILVWPKASIWCIDKYEDEFIKNNISLDNIPGLMWVRDQNTEEEYMINQKLLKANKSVKKPGENKGCMDRIPFWLHLLLTLFIPFAILLGLAIHMTLDKTKVIDRADLIREDIVLTTLVSNYIHETQKERGATGVFMGSKKEKFSCEILAQYVTTNLQKALLQYFLNTEFANVKLVTKLTFLHALIMMMGIDDNRDEVQELAIKKGDALAWYTTQNMYFVGIVAQVCRDSHLHDDSIIHLVYSNLAFVSAKEKAGVERAKGTVAFGDNIWKTHAAYKTFVQLVAGQDTHLYFFSTYISARNLDLYEYTIQDPATQACNRMREVALENNSTIMALYEAATWFDNMTTKIGLVRDVERTLAQQLTEESIGVVSSTTAAMLWVVGLLILWLITDGLMILGLVRTNETLKKNKIGQKGIRSYRREDICCWQFWVGLNNLSFVAQILIPVLLCALGLIVISWMLLSEQVTNAQSAATTWENMNLSLFMSNYIHETQKERGATGVFMVSKGTNFGTKLRVQKELCSEHNATLQEFFANEYIDYGKLKLLPSVIFFMNATMYLPEHRKRVINFKVTTGEGLGYYTIMNKNIVKTVAVMALRSSVGSIEGGLLAYLGYMYMKEKAGNERAVGTLGFSSNLWPDQNSMKKFISLVAIQEAAYLYFEQFGSEETITLHAKLETSKVAKLVLTWQGYALDNKTENTRGKKDLSMKSVDAADWFDNTTYRINQFRIVENMVADELNAFFDAMDNDTQHFVIVITIALSALLLLTIFVGFKGVRLLLRTQNMDQYINTGKKKRKRRKKVKTEN